MKKSLGTLMIRQGALVLAGVLLATGCGDGETNSDEAVASDSPTPSTSPTPSPSPTPSLPPVSLRTSCQVLFTGNGPGPLEDMQVAFDVVTINDARLARIRSGIEETREIANQAQPELAAQLRVMADETEGLLDGAISGGGEGMTDTTIYKAAGLEITQICLDVL